MELLAAFDGAVASTAEIVKATPAVRLDAPTPCAEWDVRARAASSRRERPAPVRALRRIVAASISWMRSKSWAPIKPRSTLEITTKRRSNSK